MTLKKKIKVLLIEDEEFDMIRVKKTVNMLDDRIEIINSVSDGMAAIELLTEYQNLHDVVVMDFQIAGGLFGESLIKKIKDISPLVQIIVITKMTLNISDFNFANSLLEAGAFWYCTKYPSDIKDYIYQPTDFIMAINNAYEKKKLEEYKHRTNKKLQDNVDLILESKKLIGNSKATLRLMEQISKYADSDATILIQGPSGSGKELIANQLHYRSNRKYEKFITINCGSIPSELIESELFGFEKGSFTGAEKPKLGMFEVANKGTIFLDEVGELSLTSQVKLLRVLENNEIEKIGRTGVINIDVRIIAATNIDLRKAVEENKFREDLFYRLSIIPISAPSLKEKTEDIPELMDFFLEKFCSQNKSIKPIVSNKSIEVLKNYDWPGNIRELKNVVQRLILNCEDEISEEDVLSAIGILKNNGYMEITNLASIFDKNEIRPLKDVKLALYRKYIAFVREHSLSDSDAAKKLGLARSNYSRLYSELGLK